MFRLRNPSILVCEVNSRIPASKRKETTQRTYYFVLRGFDDL